MGEPTTKWHKSSRRVMASDDAVPSDHNGAARDAGVERRRKPKLKAAGRDAQVGDTVFWNHFTLGESECDRPEDSSIEGGSGVVTECMHDYVMAKRISIPRGRVAKRIPRIEITGRTPKHTPAAPADVFSPATKRPAKSAAKNALMSPAADAPPSSPPKKPAADASMEEQLAYYHAHAMFLCLL